MSVVFTTCDDEREAREIAENLSPRRAMALRVLDLARIGLRTPRTSDRWAIIAEPSR